MSEPLIATKLNIPQPRPNFISRSRLLKQLEDDLLGASGFTRKITLVSAPAGYGKTTLVADWGTKLRNMPDSKFVNQIPTFCWLSLEEGDNDQVRFLVYFIAALKQVSERLGETTIAMLQSQQPPPPDVLLASLINDIVGTPSPLVLILDDYHLIHTPTIHQMLNFLIEHQPPQMHMVILTREDPPLPLPKLRVRGQITEIRQDDLRFTLEEMEDYLGKVVGLNLTKEDMSALERRTEGWVAGLQLAALSMQGRSNLSSFIKAFTGSNRYILDYLIEEVFKQQPLDMQDFLLKISVLDRLSAPLCDFVAGRSNSRELLQSLEHANLFIVALDQEREWYRFHRLFVELLRHRLRVSDDLSKARFHGRASLWYEENGYQAEAVRHALIAEDWERAAGLIQSSSDALLSRGEVMTLIGWIRQLPEEVIRAKPELCGDYGWALLLVGELDLAEPLLSHAERYFQDDPQSLGGIASAQAYLARARGDVRETIEKSEKALSLLPETDLSPRSIVAVNLGLTYWHGGYLNEAEKALKEAVQAGYGSGNIYTAVAARVFIARTEASRGNLHQAADQYQQLIQDGGPVPMLALTHLDLSGLNYEWNNLEVSEEHRRQGMELCKRSGNVEFEIAGELLKVRLKMAQGALDTAYQAAQRANKIAQDFSPLNQARSAACLAQVSLTQGNIDGAQHWVEQMGMDGDANTFYMFLNLTRANLLMAREKRNSAAVELETCYEKASQGGWVYGLIAVRVLQSLAAETNEAALGYLKDALALAQPEGFIRTFVDAGEPLKPILQEAALQGIMPDYVGKILAAMGESTKALPTSKLVEPLSEREIEVLRLLVAGLSNREIAGKLILSLGTVKTHIHNIYGKLGSRNRAEAIARTRELELL